MEDGRDAMSHGERIRCAIDLKEPDRVPMFDTMNWSINLAGDNLSRMGKKEKDVSYPQWVRNTDVFVESQIRALDRFGHDFVHSRLSAHIMAEPLGCKEHETYWGVPVVDPCIDDPKKWRDLRFPDPAKDGKMPQPLQAIRKLGKKLPDERKGDVSITGFTRGPLTLAGVVLGVEDMMAFMFEEPDEVKELISFCCDAAIEFDKAQIDAGADHIYTPDPTCSGDMISPETFREFGLPYAKRQSEAIRRYKDRYAHHYHICGLTMDRLDDLCEIGASYISLDYADDLGEVKKRIGKRQCIAGNINPAGTLLQGTPEKIEREGKKAIKDAAPGGGYIYWTGCDWPLDVPLANVEAFFDTAKKYGRYPINIPEER